MCSESDKVLKEGKSFFCFVLFPASLFTRCMRCHEGKVALNYFESRQTSQTSIVSQAHTPRLLQYDKSLLPRFTLDKTKPTFILTESRERCWQVHGANDNTLEMLGTTVPPTLLEGRAFKHYWAVQLKPLSPPYCPFHLSFKLFPKANSCIMPPIGPIPSETQSNRGVKHPVMFPWINSKSQKVEPLGAKTINHVSIGFCWKICRKG